MKYFCTKLSEYITQMDPDCVPDFETKNCVKECSDYEKTDPDDPVLDTDWMFPNKEPWED